MGSFQTMTGQNMFINSFRKLK